MYVVYRECHVCIDFWILVSSVKSVSIDLYVFICVCVAIGGIHRPGQANVFIYTAELNFHGVRH